MAALWAYDGWNDLNMVAGEIRNPQRNIPLSLIWGVATVGALYILVNAAVQYVLPAAAVAASERPASDAVALVLGHAGASLVSAGMALSMLVTLNGTIMSGARVPFAMARDGYFFRSIAEVHPRFRTPSVAIVVQCALAIVLLLLRRKFPAVLLARHLRRVVVLHDRGQHGIRFSTPRTARRSALSRARISGGSGRVRRRFRGAPLLHVHRQLAQFGGGNSGRFWRGFQCSTFFRGGRQAHQGNRKSP